MAGRQLRPSLPVPASSTASRAAERPAEGKWREVLGATGVGSTPVRRATPGSAPPQRTPRQGRGWRLLPAAGRGAREAVGRLGNCRVPCAGAVAGLADIGGHIPFLGPVGSASAGAVAGAVGLAALGTVLAIAAVLVGASGAANDRSGAAGRPAGAALAVQLDHDLRAQGAYSFTRRSQAAGSSAERSRAGSRRRLSAARAAFSPSDGAAGPSNSSAAPRASTRAARRTLAREPGGTRPHM
jgi:hypothetical protein